MKNKLMGYTLGVLVMLVWATLSNPAEGNENQCFMAQPGFISAPVYVTGPVAWSEWVRSPSRKRQPYCQPWPGYRLSRKRWQRYQRRLQYLLEQRRTRAESGGRTEPEEERGSITKMLTAMAIMMPAVNLEMGSSWVWWALGSAGRWG